MYWGLGQETRSIGSSLISYEDVTLMDGGDSSSSESDFDDDTARVCSPTGFLGGV